MSTEDIFSKFEQGFLKLPEGQSEFSQVAWSKHPTFQGVELKHIIMGENTNGQLSYHLVRIAPGKSIQRHIHETQLETHEVIAGAGYCISDKAKLEYEPGVISIFPIGVPHEVVANEEGLYLFAKFIPALC